MNVSLRFRILAIPLLTVTLILACIDTGGPADNGQNEESEIEIDYRQEMRAFIRSISVYARGFLNSFLIIPQNGHELLTEDGSSGGNPDTIYTAAIDGLGREDLLYGYNGDNRSTPVAITTSITPFLDLAKGEGLEVLVTDYCSSRNRVDDSYARNSSMNYISFAADHRELDNIPSYPAEPFNHNANHITSLKKVNNFLYLINPGAFNSRASFLNTIAASDYDLLILDLFFGDNPLTASEVNALKKKNNGGSRLVVCYMSIGEAEDYRWYWEDAWNDNSPEWLAMENPEWPGNFLVSYWHTGWQQIIFGSAASYLDKIISAGFNGVYLDKVDSFESFEEELK